MFGKVVSVQISIFYSDASQYHTKGKGRGGGGGRGRGRGKTLGGLAAPQTPLLLKYKSKNKTLGSAQTRQGCDTPAPPNVLWIYGFMIFVCFENHAQGMMSPWRIKLIMAPPDSPAKRFWAAWRPPDTVTMGWLSWENDKSSYQTPPSF